jgi:protein-disulfide isomerase
VAAQGDGCAGGSTALDRRTWSIAYAPSAVADGRSRPRRGTGRGNALHDAPVGLTMRPRRTWLALGLAAVGLGASIASLVDFLAAIPAFCAVAGCATVRASGWAYPLGVPMPVLGVAFFAAAIGLAFVDSPRARWLRRALAIGGAAWAIFLIGLQAFTLHAWCELCLIADCAAIGYAIAVLAGATTLRWSAGRALAVVPAVLVTVGALAVWTRPVVTPPPDATLGFVHAAQRPGVTTIVEVVDFECPHCRRMHERLTAAIARAPGPVRVVRKMLPLRMHDHAMPAAIAYCSADAQGKGDEMAAALFAARPEQLTAEGCEQLAASVGCDLDRYRMDRPAAEARVAAEAAEVRAAGIRSLPTVFIGGQRIVGASKSADELTAMLAAAAN